jgi:hypothetical protein
MDYALPFPLFIGSIFQLASGISYKFLFKKEKPAPAGTNGQKN